MKITFLLALLTSWSMASAESLRIVPASIADVAVMQENEDGTYDVVCTNGNRETVTDLDVNLGNVCPNRTSSTPTGILSLQKRQDGTFDVVCRDLPRKIASADEIMKGNVCIPPQPLVQLEDGNYTVTSGYMSYCPQEIKAHHAEGHLDSLIVYFRNPCAASRDMLCTNNICTSSDYKIEVIHNTSYRFSNRDGSEVGVFEKR